VCRLAGLQDRKQCRKRQPTCNPSTSGFTISRHTWHHVRAGWVLQNRRKYVSNSLAAEQGTTQQAVFTISRHT
jgi:hypothetical protein